MKNIERLKSIIKESIKDEINNVKNKGIEDKIKQAENLLKIIEQYIRAYIGLIKEATRLGLESEVNKLTKSKEQKEQKYNKVEAHLNSLKSQIGKSKSPKTKVKDDKSKN